MKSSSGSHNYKQKKRLMKLAPEQYSRFKDDWENNLKYLEENS